MPQRRLLYLDTNNLAASLWSGGTLREEARFEPDGPGLAAFSAYLAKHRRSLFYLAADIAEEGFLTESLPYTQGADRRALLTRKLGQYFYGAPLATAISLGRDKGGRRDEKFLFTALNRPQLFEPWLEALRAAEALLAGVYSLPLLGGPILAKIAPNQERCLLVSVTRAGIRQSYFEGGQIRFSRLTPMAAADARQMAESCAAEAVKIYQYLLGQRLLVRGAPLAVAALVHPAQMPAFREQCKNTDELRVTLHDLHDAGKACGLKSLPQDSRCEALYLHLLAQRPPREQFAAGAERRLYRLWQVRSALLSGGAVALLGCLLYSGHQAVQVIQSRSSASALQQQAEADQQRYAEIQKTFPPMPTSTESLRAVINRFEDLEKRSATPLPLYLAISRALDANPKADIERIDWQLGGNPEEGLQTLSDARKPAAPGAPPDKSAAGAMYATAVVYGLLPTSMSADQHSQLDSVNAFATTLEQDKDLRVRVVRMPFDIESGKSLKSGSEAGAGASQPKFIVHISRKL